MITHGRKVNVTCNNPNCPNYKKIIGRVYNFWLVEACKCQICGKVGVKHDYTCKAKKGKNIECNCELQIS